MSWDVVYITSSSPTQLPNKDSDTPSMKKGERVKRNIIAMSSTVITIPNEDGNSPNQKKKSQFSLSFSVPSFLAKQSKYDKRKVLHSIKVGIALVLVSLLYLLDPMYKRVGDNAMWAIMTVVVIFEFTAGLSPF